MPRGPINGIPDCSEVPRHGPAFCGRAGRVVRDHPARLPVPGEHHVGGRRAPAREFRRQPDPPRVGGHVLDAGGPGSSGRPGVIQTMRASTRRVPRAAGVFSGIRPMASPRHPAMTIAASSLPFTALNYFR